MVFPPKPRLAIWVKWHMAWAGPLWRWANGRVDRWHDDQVLP